MVGIVVFLVALQVTCYIALQFPSLQTWLAKRVISTVQSNINGKINIDRVYIIFFNKIILKNVSVVSEQSFPNQSDTLLSCEKLSVGLSPGELLKMKIQLTTVSLQNGVFNLQSETDSTTNLSRIFKSNNPKQKDTTQGKPLNLLANKLKLKNFRFTLNNPLKYIDKGDSTINFADLNVSDINININNIRLQNDTLFANVNNISGVDKSGFKLASLSCNLELSSTETRLKNLSVSDSYSRIKANYYSMKYQSAKDLSEFTDKVILGADFTDTYLNFKTIGKIAPTLSNSSLAFYVTGEAVGPVANIRSKSLQVTSESGETYVNIGVKLIGLPDITQTMAIAEISDCYTTSNDIARIVASIHNTPQSAFFRNLAPFIQYKFKGGFSGLLTDFVANGKLISPIGNVTLDVLFKTDSQKNGVIFKGHVATYNVNVGRLISNKMIGEISLKTTFSSIIRSNENGGTELSIDDLKIDKLGFNGYNYSNINAVGVSTKQDFDGRIVCHDPNLDFIFQGMFKYSTKEESKYDFYLDVPYANLAAINVDKRDSISEVNVRAIANFAQSASGDIVGSIDIKNSGYINSKGSFNWGAIKITGQQNDSISTNTLVAPFAKASFKGTAPLTQFIKKVTAISLYSKFNNFFGKENLDTIIHQKDDYTFSLQTFNSNGVCEFLLPGLYIQDSTLVEATLNHNDSLQVRLHSGRIALGENYLKDLTMNLNNNDSIIKANLFSNNIRIAGIKMDSTIISLTGENNILNASFNFQSDTTLNNRATMNVSVDFLKDPQKGMKINIKDSEIALRGEVWKFAPADIIIADSTFRFNNLKLYNGEQDLQVNGFINKKVKDSLSMQLNHFNIGVVNLFLSKSFDIEGYFSGNALYSAAGKEPKIFLDLTGDSVYVYHQPVGRMKVLSKWDDANKRFNLLVNSRQNEISNLSITGYYQPDSTYIDVKASLNDLSVIYFEPFLSDIISKTNGNLSGELRLYGPVNKLKLTGNDCIFNNFDFTVNFTQVPYRLNGPVQITENGIFVKDLSVTDQYGSIGKVSGGLSYNYFKDIFLDTKIVFDNFQCLNTRERDNEAFYGSAFATGSLVIQGPLTKLLLDANIQSDAKTAIHIPLSNSATANQTNLLTFVPSVNSGISSGIDTYQAAEEAKKLKIKQPTELAVQLRANVTPQAEIMIEIDKATGDIIKVNGSGLINMNINPSKELFDIYGDYSISQGSYKFIRLKDFMIQPGGMINFNGGIANTTLNLTAIYRTKAAINTLIADTSSVSTRRTVDCEIGMSGQLTNPELALNITIPDLDPTTKVRVESALNSAGKIQKQFMALLVSGSFIPDEQSGIANNSTILYSNASEILSNQLNNVLQQLGIPLDLGLNYQPGTKGNDVFDVAVSTQLFNNRVLINGNIGNDPSANTNNRDVIGNLDIEIKLDKNGHLRLDLFSHAADKFSNYLDDKQRSGVGFVYQQEFNNFKDLFRKKTPEQKVYDREKKKREKEHKAREKQLKKAEAKN